MAIRTVRARLVMAVGAAVLTAAVGTAVAVPATAASTHSFHASAPTITGHSKVGYTLTAHEKISPKPSSEKYQWYANGHSIPGATHPVYTIANKYAGERITVKVVSAKHGYRTATTTSRSIGAVAQGTLTVSSASHNYTVSGSTAHLRIVIHVPAGSTVTYTYTVNGKRYTVKGTGAITLSIPTPTAKGASETVTVSISVTKQGYVTIHKSVSTRIPSSYKE